MFSFASFCTLCPTPPRPYPDPTPACGAMRDVSAELAECAEDVCQRFNPSGLKVLFGGIEIGLKRHALVFIKVSPGFEWHELYPRAVGKIRRDVANEAAVVCADGMVWHAKALGQ